MRLAELGPTWPRGVPRALQHAADLKPEHLLLWWTHTFLADRLQKDRLQALGSLLQCQHGRQSDLELLKLDEDGD